MVERRDRSCGGKRRPVLLGAARTPFGKLGGALARCDATDLAARAIEKALTVAEVRPEDVEQVVLGQAMQDGQGQIPSRQAQIKASLPQEVPSETVNKACASGMRALGIVESAIRAGDVSVAVAGGMESMSNTPVLLPGLRFGFRAGRVSACDALAQGLTSPWTGKLMITEADEAATAVGITREELDVFASRSHALATLATDAGLFADEMVPVTVSPGVSGAEISVDEAIRRDTTLEALAVLPAITGPEATHTAGNAPGPSDGACAVVLASPEWADGAGCTPLARVLSYGAVAGGVSCLLTSPAGAVRQALAKAGLRPSEVDVWEINEAFASVTLNTIRILALDEERVNVNGGAIALGHPVGASGARLVTTLVYELRRRGGGLGCAAICSAGGQGDAMVIEVSG